MSPRSAGTLKRIEFLVLAVLQDGPLHGYGIAQDIDLRTGGEVSIRPGSLYRVLDRLVRMGLLEPTEEGSSGNDDRRRDYAITACGKEALLTEARLLVSVAGKVLSNRENPA